jgi:hypothetical protein
MSGVLYSHVTTTMISYGCDLKIVCATIPCAVCAHKYHYCGVGRGRDCRVCYSVHIAACLPACEYEYQVTPWTVLAPAAGAICCLLPSSLI